MAVTYYTLLAKAVIEELGENEYCIDVFVRENNLILTCPVNDRKIGQVFGGFHDDEPFGDKYCAMRAKKIVGVFILHTLKPILESMVPLPRRDKLMNVKLRTPMPTPQRVEGSLDFKNFAVRRIWKERDVEKITFYHIPSGTEAVVVVRKDEVTMEGGMEIGFDDRTFMFFMARKIKFGF